MWKSVGKRKNVAVLPLCLEDQIQKIKKYYWDKLEKNIDFGT